MISGFSHNHPEDKNVEIEQRLRCLKIMARFKLFGKFRENGSRFGPKQPGVVFFFFWGGGGWIMQISVQMIVHFCV